jgi:hypothetical protein
MPRFWEGIALIILCGAIIFVGLRWGVISSKGGSVSRNDQPFTFWLQMAMAMVGFSFGVVIVVSAMTL